MVLNGDDGLESNISMDEEKLAQMSKFRYMGCFLDKLGINVAMCHIKVDCGRKVGGAIRSLINDSGLQVEHAA